MKNYKLLIFGGNYYALPLYNELIKLGYYLICVDRDVNAPCGEISHEFINVDYSDYDALIKSCTSFSEVIPIAINDYGVMAIGNLNKYYNINSNITYHQSVIGTQKFKMREFLVDADINCPRYKICSDINSIQEFQEEIGSQIIIKPSAGIGGGNRGVIVVENDSQINNAMSFHNEYFSCGNYLVEECIQTIKEYSVDFIISEGNAQILCIGENEKYDKIFKVNKSILYKYNLDPLLKSQFQEAANKILKNLFILNGAIHIEFMLDQSGNLYVIEFGLRPGGGPIFHSVVKYLYGISYPKLYIDSLMQISTEIKALNKTSESLTIHFYSSHEEKELIQKNSSNIVFRQSHGASKSDRVLTGLERLGYLISLE